MVIAYIDGQPVEASTDTRQLLAQFGHLPHPVDLWEEEGHKYLGRFTPPQAVAEPPIVPWEPGLTKEEFERRARESPRMTLDEFWRKMGVK
jgi:hypothetical protein